MKLKVIRALILAMGTMSVQAQFVSIDITAWTNVNIRTWTNGSQYPTGNRTLNVGGIPMYVTILNNDPNSLGVISLPGDGTLHAWDIPANVSGATALYTLMNNAWGVCGRNLGTIEVFGQNGSYASLTLIEGFNIRDHYNGGYCNTLTDPTAFAFTFGSVRLDRQKLELPASFATDIITRIRFSGVGRRPDGAAFLASLTLQGCEVSNGDVNQDGCVDDTDLAAVIFAFGQEGPGMPEDMDCNAIIDDADLATVIFHFGEGC